MYSQQNTGLPLQGRTSGLPSAMDRQFQSRIDPRMIASQMPSSVNAGGNAGGNNYQHPMYGGNMRQQQLKKQQQQQQQQRQPQTPANMQQMSPQLAQQYQQQQAQIQSQQRQMQQQMMQQQAAMMAAKQQQQMMQQGSQFKNQQQQSSRNNGMSSNMLPGMMPASSPMPPTIYGGNIQGMNPGGMGGPEWVPTAAPQFDSQGNPITPSSLQAQQTSMRGKGHTSNIEAYDQHDQYNQAKASRNLNPKNHVLFICPSKCKYSSDILDYLSSNNLIKNFTIIDLADPRVNGVPEFLTVVPTLYKPQERRKYTEDDLKKWIISHFGNPTQAVTGFRTNEKTSTQITNMDGLRALGDLTGDGNDIFTAMTDQGAPLSNNPNEYEVAHTTVLEGSLSRFDDINKGLHTVNFNDHSGGSMQALTGGSVTPGELRPSDKGRMRDPNAPPLIQEPINEPGKYIEGNPFEVRDTSGDRRNARKDELSMKFQQLQEEREKDMKMRPRNQQQQQRQQQKMKTYTYLPR